MTYFNNCANLDELKKEYKRLAKLNHPDLGGSTETMQEINAEYEKVFKVLQKKHNETNDENHQSTEAPDEFINIINELLKLDGLEIELCGRWLWIGGNTREHKDTLKALGCRWASKKKLWSWHHEEDGSIHFHGKKSIDEIREKYGSEKFIAGHNNFARLGATA